MSRYYGDFVKGATVRIPFNTTGTTGASITIATNGTPKVYKDGGTTELTTGVALVEDHDGVTGRHYITVDTSQTGFTMPGEYDVCIDSNTIDGISVSAWVGSFSMGRITIDRPVMGLATAGAAGSITLPASASSTNSVYNGALATIVAGTGAGQSRLISGYVGSTKVASIEPNWAVTPDNTSVVVVTLTPPAAPSERTAIAKANRDDAIQMLLDGITTTTADGSGTMTVKDSTGATVTITITRAAANAITSLT